jgi:outer membrane protein
MKKSLISAAILSVAVSAAAQRVDFFVDVEGVRRTGGTTAFTPGVTRFDPAFKTGGGIGGGVNWFFSDRVSLEAKVAALASKAQVRVIGSDFVLTVDLGWAQLYPISAVVQWHLAEHGTIRPYIGAGAVHTVLRNINKRIGASATGIRFKDPTGVVVDGGLEFSLSKKWSLLTDARYVPIETKSQATFPGTPSSIDLHVRPLIVSFGLGYHH